MKITATLILLAIWLTSCDSTYHKDIETVRTLCEINQQMENGDTFNARYLKVYNNTKLSGKKHRPYKSGEDQATYACSAAVISKDRSSVQLGIQNENIVPEACEVSIAGVGVAFSPDMEKVIVTYAGENFEGSCATTQSYRTWDDGMQSYPQAYLVAERPLFTEDELHFQGACVVPNEYYKTYWSLEKTDNNLDAVREECKSSGHSWDSDPRHFKSEAVGSKHCNQRYAGGFVFYQFEWKKEENHICENEIAFHY